MLRDNLEDIDKAVLDRVLFEATKETGALEFEEKLLRTIDGCETEFSRSSYAKDKFAQNVCAMANSQGGEILYGVKAGEGESQGRAQSLTPIPPIADSFDEANQCLIDVLDQRLQPKLSEIDFRWIPVKKGYVLVVRVPRCSNTPLRARDGNKWRYMVRDGDSIKVMNREELRRAFARSLPMLEELRTIYGPGNVFLEKGSPFYTERLEKIMGEKIWSPLSAGPYCVVHWIPGPGRAGFITDDFRQVERFCSFILMEDRSSPRQNQYGVEFHSILEDKSTPERWRENIVLHRRWFWNAQIFSSGAAEMAFAIPYYTIDGRLEKFIPPRLLAREIRKAMAGFQNGMKCFDAKGSFRILVSVLFAKNCKFWESDSWRFPTSAVTTDRLAAGREIREFQEMKDSDEVASPILHSLWQSFGSPRCEYFDESEKWNLR